MHRRGGEADLVVDDEMNGAAGAETFGAAHREAFGHHALTGKGRIAMQQKRQHARPLHRVAQLPLLGARLAQHHGIFRFEVGRIGGQGQMHIAAVEFAV